MTDADGKSREITDDEADVIESAQDLVMAWEGGHYGPMQHEIKRCEKELVTAVANLCANNDGVWRRPP